MIKKNKVPFLIFFLISFFNFVFYLFFINFSSDSVYLYIPQKIFLKTWLLRGIIPIYNPQLFVGIPFLSDTNMGHLHPFSLLFLLPYPVSFALFVSACIFLYLYGFYLFFRNIAKSDKVALLGVFFLLFSGSGLLRINNPAVFLVLIHFGFLLYFTKDLQKKTVSIPLIITGMLMTVGGHNQFVLYGHVMIVLAGLILYRVSLKRIFINNAIILFAMCWYYLLAFPQIIQSTRITTDINYIKIGTLIFQQLFTLVFPYIFGILKDGSLWNSGVKYEILSSILFVPFLFILFIKRKISLIYFLIFAICLIYAFGYITLPFLRGASQIFIVIHIFGVVLIVRHFETIELTVYSLISGKRRILFLFFVLIFFSMMFVFSPLFTNTVLFLIHTIKKGATNLFFDNPTVSAIGGLIGYSLIIWLTLFVLLLFSRKKIHILNVLILFLVGEGLIGLYFHNYFIPQSIITERISIPKKLTTTLFRIQSTQDVIPYTGFHMYLGNILFRPPFSKEPAYIDSQENKTFNKLRNILSFLPSNWAMMHNLYTVQGYNALVPKKLALFFKEPSSDYKSEYDYMIKRNPLFAQSETGADINVIETSRITIYDPRWEQLAVRYFISDRPLKKYKLIYQDNRYFYENEKAPPIYGIVENGSIKAKPPYYEDPNQMKFKIMQNETGKLLQIIINPYGFVVEYNGKKILPKIEDFKINIPLSGAGEIKVFYSPVEHLRQALKTI